MESDELLYTLVPQLGQIEDPMAGFRGIRTTPAMGSQLYTGVVNTNVTPEVGGGLFANFLPQYRDGKKVSDGWGGYAIGGASALMNALLGMRQLGLAKNQLNENRRQFDLNYDAQRRLINSALEDRQRARLASNPGAFQSIDDYMARHGIR